jgi:flavin-dependent dehydrogenase
VLDVDMRLLVARLQALAREAGARFVESVRVRGFDDRQLATSHGPCRARYFVDASGLAGARLLSQRRLPAQDVCVAAQSVRRVTDASAARAFFLKRGAEPGETLCFTSVAGGYSIVNAHLDGDGVSILTGSIPALGVPSGRALLSDFANKHDWIGEEIFGGARALPLGRARDHLAYDDVALLGDAALQIFSAHGSGIGAGMVAARKLADVIAAGRPLHDYSVAWHRELGPCFAAYDVFRRFSQTLTREEVETLVTSGLMSPAMARPALAQNMPPSRPSALLGRVPSALRAPALALRLASVAPRMAAAWLASRRYPDEPDGVSSWAQRTCRTLGDRGVEPAPRRRARA